jgi:hypothetical protein
VEIDAAHPADSLVTGRPRGRSDVRRGCFGTDPLEKDGWIVLPGETSEGIEMERTSTQTAERTDGLIIAPIDGGGVWSALRALRRGMQRLGEGGHAAFITAMSSDGRIVTGRDPDASVLVMGYRCDTP